MKIINKRVLIRPIYPEEKTKHGIIVANYENHSKYTREVFANQGTVVDKDERVTDVEIGDKVIFVRFGAIALEIDGEELLFLNPIDISAIIN